MDAAVKARRGPRARGVMEARAGRAPSRVTEAGREDPSLEIGRKERPLLLQRAYLPKLWWNLKRVPVCNSSKAIESATTRSELDVSLYVSYATAHLQQLSPSLHYLVSLYVNLIAGQ